MGYNTVLLEVRDKLGWVYMNRPEKYNAMNTAMLRELVAAVEELEESPEAKVIALSGRGKAFSAGIDLC